MRYIFLLDLKRLHCIISIFGEVFTLYHNFQKSGNFRFFGFFPTFWIYGKVGFILLRYGKQNDRLQVIWFLGKYCDDRSIPKKQKTLGECLDRNRLQVKRQKKKA